VDLVSPALLLLGIVVAAGFPGVGTGFARGAPFDGTFDVVLGEAVGVLDEGFVVALPGVFRAGPVPLGPD
jgi:hypothetical protein